MTITVINIFIRYMIFTFQIFFQSAWAGESIDSSKIYTNSSGMICSLQNQGDSKLSFWSTQAWTLGWGMNGCASWESSKFQLYCLLSWCVVQEHFYMEAGVQVNISWGFFCFTYTCVEFVYSELICSGESVSAINGKCKFFELVKSLLETSHSFLNWANGHMYLWSILRSFIALTFPFPLNAHVILHLQKASKFSPIGEG